VRPAFPPSFGGGKSSLLTSMFDLTYLRGTLKNVTTGEGGGDEVRIGGNTQLPILLKAKRQLI
jgi:hypothetical protein